MGSTVTATAAGLHYGRGLWSAALLMILCIHSVPVFAVNNSGSLESPWLKTKDIHANVHYQVDSLVGEPVVNARIDWRPTDVASHVPSIYRSADPSLYNATHYGQVSEAESKLRLYDAKVSLKIKHGNNTYYLDADAGVPAKPGKERSYNVPGSPGWGSLLRNSVGHPVEPGVAKEIMRAGLNVTEARVTSYKVDTSKFQEWWLEKNVDRYTKPLKEAIDRKLNALSDACGLPVDNLRKEVAALRGSGKADADIAKLQGILDKLSPQNLPKKYLGEGPERLVRLHRYAQEVQGADQWLAISTKDLPPMPGTSRLYDNWYQQMEVRLAKNRLQLAQLEEKKYEIALAERQALEAEARERERRERVAREERAEREQREQNKRMAAQRKARVRERQQAARDAQRESADFWGSVLEGMQNSGWGAPGYAGGCGAGQSRIGGVCMYVDPSTGAPYGSSGGSTGSSPKCGRLADCHCDNSCSTFAYPTFNK